MIIRSLIPVPGILTAEFRYATAIGVHRTGLSCVNLIMAEAVILKYGTYVGKDTEPGRPILVRCFSAPADLLPAPGIHYSSCFGRDLHIVSTKQTSVDLPIIKILDLRGSP